MNKLALIALVLLAGCDVRSDREQYLVDIYCGDSVVAAEGDAQEAAEYARTHDVVCK